MARLLQGPGEPETGGAGLVGDAEFTMSAGEFLDEPADLDKVVGQFPMDHLAGGTVDRGSGHAAGMDIQSQACSLGEHQGLL